MKVKTEQMTSLLLENKEKTFLLEQKKDQTEEINRLKEEKRLVEQELKKTQAELYRAHLEKDVYEKYIKIYVRKHFYGYLEVYSKE